MANKPAHQPYPSMRFHKEGTRTTIVNSEEHELALHEREPDTWFDKPQPKPVPPPPKRETTLADIDARLESMEDELRILKAANNELVRSNGELNEAVSELSVQVEALTSSSKSTNTRRGA